MNLSKHLHVPSSLQLGEIWTWISNQYGTTRSSGKFDSAITSCLRYWRFADFYNYAVYLFNRRRWSAVCNSDQLPLFLRVQIMYARGDFYAPNNCIVATISSLGANLFMLVCLHRSEEYSSKINIHCYFCTFGGVGDVKIRSNRNSHNGLVCNFRRKINSTRIKLKKKKQLWKMRTNRWIRE